jgi:hypothetical protein
LKDISFAPFSSQEIDTTDLFPCRHNITAWWTDTWWWQASVAQAVVFFSSADFQVCACHFSIHNCNITCLASLMCNVQLFLSLLSDALLSGYKLHHHLDPERSHGVCKSKYWLHGADMNAVPFLHVLWILCIYMPSSSQRHNVSWSGSTRALRCEQNPGVAPLLCSLPKSISCLVEIQEWSLLSQACLDGDTVEWLPKNKSRGFCRRRAAWPVKMISYMGSCSLACSRHKEAALLLSQCLMPSLLMPCHVSICYYCKRWCRYGYKLWCRFLLAILYRNIIVKQVSDMLQL